MIWLDVVATAELLALCAIAYGVFRVRRVIEDLHHTVCHDQELIKNILFQVDSGDHVPPDPRRPRFPLDVEVHMVRDDLRAFVSKWNERHLPDLARHKPDAPEMRNRAERAPEI